MAIVLTRERKKYSPPLVIYLGYYNIKGAKGV